MTEPRYRFSKGLARALFSTFLILLVGDQFAYSQQSGLKIPDSLAGKDYDYFIEKLDADSNNAELDKLYGNVYLRKAMREKNWGHAINAWKTIIHKSHRNLKLVYTDSLIATAKQSKDKLIIAKAHIYKGAVLYQLNRYQQALEEYLLADRLIAGTGNKYYAYQLKYLIGQIKCYLGYYEEAIALLRESVVFYQAKGGRPYLSALHSLGICYQKTRQLDRSSATNSLGLKEALATKDTEVVPYFINSEGVNQYLKGHYKASLESLNKSYIDLSKGDDIANQTTTLFYIGKNYLALGQEEKAMPYIKKVDEAFVSDTFIRPELREAYEILINHHHAVGDLKMELHYNNQLRKVDGYLINNFKYLSTKILKEYDARKLLQETKKQRDDETKELREAHRKTQEVLQKRNTTIKMGIVIFMLLLAMIVYAVNAHRKDKRVTKQKFEKYLEKKNAPKKIQAPRDENALDINPDIVESILRQTEQLRHSKKFLEKDLSVTKLAEYFNSNTTYVSKVINHYKGCKVMEHIYELKVDYIVELLQAEKKYRNYTNKALADEAGFSTVQQFVKCFEKQVGLSPTNFIGQLKELKGEV